MLCVIPVDRLLAVFNDSHDSIVRPTPEPLLIDRQCPPHRVKEAHRIHEVFVGSPGALQNAKLMAKREDLKLQVPLEFGKATALRQTTPLTRP